VQEHEVPDRHEKSRVLIVRGRFRRLQRRAAPVPANRCHCRATGCGCWPTGRRTRSHPRNRRPSRWSARSPSRSTWTSQPWPARRPLTLKRRLRPSAPGLQWPHKEKWHEDEDGAE